MSVYIVIYAKAFVVVKESGYYCKKFIFTVKQLEKSKRRRDENYFREAEEEEHNPKPTPTDDNTAKMISDCRTCLFFKLFGYTYSE